MRIACVDSSAADRLALLENLDGCLGECRDVIGHLTLFQPYPVSKDELLVSTPPDAVVVGPRYSLDEAFLLCRDVRRAHSEVPILVLVAADNYSFRTMQRFDAVALGVYSLPGESHRLVHTLCQLAIRRRAALKTGKLVVLRGVKGGVGSTSIAAALAHSAQALNRNAILVDLSSASALSLYALAGKRQSGDYASFLMDGTIPDRSAIERCIVKAPNGLHLLLPPAGGAEMRELWLRNADRFEVTLAVLEMLSELYDLVLIDHCGVEGVLQYALCCRASQHVLISSNDPASVHLLGAAYNSATQLPGNAEIRLIINEVYPAGLSNDDILDFLCVHCGQAAQELELTRLLHDSQGRGWIGTGNTFYTEASRQTQRRLEQFTAELVGLEQPASGSGVKKDRIVSWRRLAEVSMRKRKRDAHQRNIPLLLPPDSGIESSLAPFAPAAEPAARDFLSLASGGCAAFAPEPILPDAGDEPANFLISALYQPATIQTVEP